MILTFIERSKYRLCILVSFEEWRIFVQILFFQSISEEMLRVKDFDDCFVTFFMVLQKNFEFTWGMLIELIWLVSLKTFVIRKISDLLIDVMGEKFIWNHIEYDSN